MSLLPRCSASRGGMRPPAPFHDVADLAHAADIGIADARAVGAAVAVGDEAVARAAEQGALLRRRMVDGAAILVRHVPVERGKACIGADRNLALRSGLRAIEARMRAGRDGRRFGRLRLRLGLRRHRLRLLVGTGRGWSGSGNRRRRAWLRRGGRLPNPRERCERPDDHVGVTQKHDVAAAVRRRLYGVIDVRGESAPSADDRHARRQVERQRPRAIDATGRAVAAFEHRIFHPHHGIS